jgi:hypothetical protein
MDDDLSTTKTMSPVGRHADVVTVLVIEVVAVVLAVLSGSDVVIMVVETVVVTVVVAVLVPVEVALDVAVVVAVVRQSSRGTYDKTSSRMFLFKCKTLLSGSVH